ncbi:MAG: hypothetical protein AB2693_34980, partial [Candidatus Thiodiazotropha sp.]
AQTFPYMRSSQKAPRSVKQEPYTGTSSSPFRPYRVMYAVETEMVAPSLQKQLTRLLILQAMLRLTLAALLPSHVTCSQQTALKMW